MISSKKMPIWARVVAGLVGLLLMPMGIVALVAVRPLNYLLVGAAIGSAFTGATLLGAAIAGEWPLFI